jgi:glycosyltransferase involved in cell wall biosynthesis
MKLGIAVTTYNRREMLINNLRKIEGLTSCDHDIVVCDDGSCDGTRDAVTECGYKIIGGCNRGVAWNKNRGLFYLANVLASDVIILLDDDTYPIVHGWENEWIAAVQRVGHVNYLPPRFRTALVSGGMTAADLGLSRIVSGVCLAMTREAQSYVGYMDVRFGKYGHEHSDYTIRFTRAGFGAHVEITEGRKQVLYYVLDGGLSNLPSKSMGDTTNLKRNEELLIKLAADPVYRSPWRTDAELRDFREEIAASR